MSLRGAFLKRMAYPIADSLRGRHNMERLRFLRESQWWNRERMREWQLSHLRKFVEHCYENVPFYRGRFAEVGFRPEHLRCFEDLRNLPILTKQDVRDHFEQLIAENVPKHRLVKWQSGGSTGSPTPFCKDTYDEDWFHMGNYRIWEWYGFHLGDRMMLITGWTPAQHLRYRVAVMRLKEFVVGVRTIHVPELTPSCTGAVVRQIEAYDPVMITGYPSRLAGIARLSEQQPIRCRSLRAVYTSSELLVDYERSIMERYFGCPVYDIYGGTESPIAGQCERRDGYHIYDESRFVEVVDSNGQPTEPGRFGRVLVTTFFRFGFPYLRFDMGDLAEVREETICPCGRSSGLLGRPMGRTTRLCVDQFGKAVPERILMDKLLGLAGVRDVRLVQRADRSVDVSYCLDDISDNEQTEARICQAVLSALGPSTVVRLRRLAEIPVPPSGKRQIVENSEVSVAY